MQRFNCRSKHSGFIWADGMIYGHFRPRRHLMTAADYRRARAKAVQIWRQETCAEIAA